MYLRYLGSVCDKYFQFWYRFKKNKNNSFTQKKHPRAVWIALPLCHRSFDVKWYHGPDIVFSLPWKRSIFSSNVYRIKMYFLLFSFSHNQFDVNWTKIVKLLGWGANCIKSWANHHLTFESLEIEIKKYPFWRIVQVLGWDRAWHCCTQECVLYTFWLYHRSKSYIQATSENLAYFAFFKG